MKKIVFITFIIFYAAILNAWKCIDCPDYFTYHYDVYSNRNFLPEMTDRLETAHGITTYIKIEKTKSKYDFNNAARDILKNIVPDTDSKGVIVILVNTYWKKGAIEISDNLKSVFPEKYVKTLQDDVLNNLQGKWYLRLNTLLAKITGGFVYMLEKDTYTKAQIDKLRPVMIVVDDKLYSISLKPMINDIIGLFYAEPLSFLFYFPFVMYFLIVRWFGMKFNAKFFLASNGVWLVVMVFFAILIFNRINIYFPDYMAIFSLILGVNVPLYMALYNLNRGEILSSAYNYITDVTGGFDTTSSFEGKKWIK